MDVCFGMCFLLSTFFNSTLFNVYQCALILLMCFKCFFLRVWIFMYSICGLVHGKDIVYSCFIGEINSLGGYSIYLSDFLMHFEFAWGLYKTENYDVRLVLGTYIHKTSFCFFFLRKYSFLVKLFTLYIYIYISNCGRMMSCWFGNSIEQYITEKIVLLL